MPLHERDIERYARQIIIPDIGASGQLRLLAAHASIIGKGSAGSAALLYLRAAGVDAVADTDGGHSATTIDLSSFDASENNPESSARAAAAGCAAACAFIAQTLEFENIRAVGSLEDVLA